MSKELPERKSEPLWKPAVEIDPRLLQMPLEQLTPEQKAQIQHSGWVHIPAVVAQLLNAEARRASATQKKKLAILIATKLAEKRGLEMVTSTGAAVNRRPKRPRARPIIREKLPLRVYTLTAQLEQHARSCPLKQFGDDEARRAASYVADLHRLRKDNLRRTRDRGEQLTKKQLEGEAAAATEQKVLAGATSAERALIEEEWRPMIEAEHGIAAEHEQMPFYLAGYLLQHRANAATQQLAQQRAKMNDLQAAVMAWLDTQPRKQYKLANGVLKITQSTRMQQMTRQSLGVALSQFLYEKGIEHEPAFVSQFTDSVWQDAQADSSS